MEKVIAAHNSQNWAEVLELEGRMEELIEGRDDHTREAILRMFLQAHRQTSMRLPPLHSLFQGHTLSIFRFQERRIELLGSMERFRDQGEEIFELANSILILNTTEEFGVSAFGKEEAARHFQTARDLGAAHGFFSLECRACLGLGWLKTDEGRDEEAVELLQNALAAAKLSEAEQGDTEELRVLPSLLDALLNTNALEEVEPLVKRYREAGEAESRRQRRMNYHYLKSFSFSARLHEVLLIYTPRVGNPFTLLCPCIPPRPIASATGSTAPECGQTHSLTLPLSPGTREA